MIRPTLGLLLLALGSVATTATAADLCAALPKLTAEAKANFSSRPNSGAFDVGLPGDETCSLLLQLGGAKVMNCHWAFAFRDDQARAMFDALVEQIQACDGTRTVLEQDQRVNHPDSYDLRKFVYTDISIDVSLKDKGALQQTFVFLRIDGVTG